jgi:tRNA dimethylallyltransferase
MMARLFLLTGYTAVGKTELSLKLAEALNAEILSCDSVQVYRGMDIGSAKVSEADRRRIKHHGIDVADVCDQFDIQQYINYALEVTKDVTKRGKNLLIVGGSGFYLKSFYQPVVDDIAISDDIKAEVQLLYNDFGLNGLVKKINQLSGEALNNLDLKNPRRVARALERCIATGMTVEQNVARFMSQSCPFSDYKKTVVLLTRNNMHDLLRIRVVKMIENGLIDEVKSLMKSGIENNKTPSGAIGYREVISFIKNDEKNLENLIYNIVKNTNSLVKKQRIWFRKQIKSDLEICLDDYSVDESFDLMYMLFKCNLV